MYIICGTYEFSGKGLRISKLLKVKRETEKCYFTETKYEHREYRFLKSELGQLKHLTRNDRPYIEVAMVDATEEDIREKLAEWFEKKAGAIRKH